MSLLMSLLMSLMSLFGGHECHQYRYSRWGQYRYWSKYVFVFCIFHFCIEDNNVFSPITLLHPPGIVLVNNMLQSSSRRRGQYSFHVIDRLSILSLPHLSPLQFSLFSSPISSQPSHLFSLPCNYNLSQVLFVSLLLSLVVSCCLLLSLVVSSIFSQLLLFS